MPTVFKTLKAGGTEFLRGQLVLVSAGPGTGKSAFVLTLALKSKVACMYFSADSDAFEQLKRSISILTEQPLAESTRMVLENDLFAVYEDLVESPIRFNYDASPSLSSIENALEAYEEVYGEYPALIVIDNVTNVRSGVDEDDPFAGLESLMDYLHTMARETGACVIGLHHVTGSYNDAAKPIPLSGVKGQITRVPEMVLTLHKRTAEIGSDTLLVSTVKNRAGKADPSGYSLAELEFSGDSMQIRDRDSAWGSTSVQAHTREPEPDWTAQVGNGDPWAVH